MEQKNFIHSETINPNISVGKKLSFARINVMLVLGEIAVVTAAIPVGVALINKK